MNQEIEMLVGMYNRLNREIELRRDLLNGVCLKIQQHPDIDDETLKHLGLEPYPCMGHDTSSRFKEDTADAPVRKRRRSISPEVFGALAKQMRVMAQHNWPNGFMRSQMLNEIGEMHPEIAKSSIQRVFEKAGFTCTGTQEDARGRPKTYILAE